MSAQLTLGGARRVCTISDCAQYRYELGEFWDESLPFDVWILCNPSTTDRLAFGAPSSGAAK